MLNLQCANISGLQYVRWASSLVLRLLLTYVLLEGVRGGGQRRGMEKESGKKESGETATYTVIILADMRTGALCYVIQKFVGIRCGP